MISKAFQDVLREVGQAPGQDLARIPEGEEMEFAIFGEPAAVVRHWRGSRPTVCTAPDCADCLLGDRPSVKVVANIFLPVVGVFKLFEFTATTFEKLVALSAAHDHVEWTFLIAKEIDDELTRYPIRVGRQLTDSEKAAIAAAKPIDVKARAAAEKDARIRQIKEMAGNAEATETPGYDFDDLAEDLD